MAWLTAQSRNRWRALAMVAALMAALTGLALANRPAEGAEGDGCTPACVILIQVDGLEPKDVTQETTPYMWKLAHPRLAVAGLGSTPAMLSRSGWIWQAPRGVVGSGTAPATAALLSGGYPEMNGVPADDFYGPTSSTAPFTHQRLGAGGLGDIRPNGANGDDFAQPLADLAVDTPLTLIDGGAGVFLGDPGLAPLVDATTNGNPYWFPPGQTKNVDATTPEGQFTGDPRLCPIPRYPDGVGSANPSWCPANDMTTANKAIADLKLGPNSSVGFTFLHLAELGAAKRLAADLDPDPDGDPDTPPPPQPAEALANTDAAIASFVEQYAVAAESKWTTKTVLMVVGTHGYQRTPPSNRVPNPTPPADDPGSDLADYVASFTAPGPTEGSPGVTPGTLRLVPQGTMATIYYGPPGNGTAADRAHALKAIKDALEGDAMQTACAGRAPGLPRCIERVSYTDPATLPDTVGKRHPSWRLDTRDPDNPSVRTRAAGDLVVELGRGWAAGRAVGVPFQANATGKPFSNPYAASSGGPQERAVAALINGPATGFGAVRDLDSFLGPATAQAAAPRYPVFEDKVAPSTAGSTEPPRADDAAKHKCPATPSDPTSVSPPDPGGLACANDPDAVGDDANVDGHEFQPETVDFAITISALMGLQFSSHPKQLQGRVLQEAFLTALSPPCVENCEPEEVIQEDPPPIELPPPPIEIEPQQDPFPFYGLVRRLKSRVVDGRNRTYRAARRGAVLSTIRLEGDFGKPEAAVTLTFYRQSRSAARSSRVVRLKPIARFDPFVVSRGHVTMRLKVPPLFKPTYVGLTVRQIAHLPNGRRRLSGAQPCTRLKTRLKVKFRCVGATRGAILRIVDAGYLHKRKGGARRPPRR